MKHFHISNQSIGVDQPVYIIAEAGVNHNGDINLAHQLIDAAKKSGADAIKFQYFITENLVSDNTPKADYQKRTTGNNDSQFSMLKSLELTKSHHAELMKHCQDVDITYLCTPYDVDSLQALLSINVPAVKLASTDTTNIPFLKKVSQSNIPIILSTGMCDLSEIELAVTTIENTNQNVELILLHCISSYPTPIDEINLTAINTLKHAFNMNIGFSDHTQEISTGAWAAAFGAVMLEKHFTLDKTMIGPDHESSLTPLEMESYIKQVRMLELAKGDGVKRVANCEIMNKPIMQKSLVARSFINKGAVLTEENLTAKRPSSGISPKMFDQILGKKVNCDIEENTIIKMDMIDWTE